MSISIKGAHDGAGQPREKVLDLKITGAAMGDTDVMSAIPSGPMPAAPRQPKATPETSEVPVVNIVVGSGTNVLNGEILAGQRGNGGCAGSFGGDRAAPSVGGARARGATAGSAPGPVPALFGGKDGNGSVFSGGSVFGGGSGGVGGQSGAVSAVGYQSIAFGGFVGSGQSSNDGWFDETPRDDGSEVDADPSVNGRNEQPEDISDEPGDVTATATNDEATRGIDGPWGNGLADLGGRNGYVAAGGPMRTASGANGGGYGTGHPSTNGHSGPHD